LIAAVLLCAACPAASRASIEVGDLIMIGDGVGYPGGISLIDDLNDPGSPDFDSFCVEITEFVDTFNTFAVQNIGLVTDLGGKTLSSYTAWLYNRYLDRAVNGFTASFNAADANDVNALQLAIWKGMGYTPLEVMAQVGPSWYMAYNFVLGFKPWQSQFAADTSWSGVGDIRIMNLRKVGPLGVYTDYAQDQLVRLPPPEPTPEPLSIMVWSLLACCVGAARFRAAR
jgi:hypothetical protein